MELSDQQYGRMIEWMEYQQRRLAELETENRALRDRLDELRRGVGVMVMIQGRAYPLANGAPVAAPRTAEFSHATGGFPAVQPSHTAPCPAVPSRPTPPMGTPRIPPHAQAFPETDWLTGQMRSVHAPAEPPRQPQPQEPPRRARPSQEMTPSWLRDEWSASRPVAPRPPSGGAGFPPSTPRAQPQPPADPTPARWPQRARPASLPLPSDQHRVPSLAELTGHRASLRDWAAPSGSRSPYADSYVLG
jgi:hypothetical protein